MLLYLCYTLAYLGAVSGSGCVFGWECFYRCRCHFSQCSGADSSCEDCDDLTGKCRLEQTACQYDDFTSPLYHTNYWTGAACQKGNIAQGKLYSIEGLFSFEPANGGATDGTFTFSVSAFISPFSHVIIIDLEGDHVVEVIDLYVKFELSVEELSSYVEVTLETETGDIMLCSLVPSDTQDNHTTSNNTADQPTRMRFLCKAPSRGAYVKLRTLETNGVNIPVTVYEVVIIGYRYADIQQDRCLEMAGDGEIQWCTLCNNSLPPECRHTCQHGTHGLNCQNMTDSTPSPGPPDHTLALAVGLSLGGALLIVLVLIIIIVKTHPCKRTNQTSDYEIYDQIEESEMTKHEKAACVTHTDSVPNDYLHPGDVRGPTHTVTSHINDGYLTQSSINTASSQGPIKVPSEKPKNLDETPQKTSAQLSSEYLQLVNDNNISSNYLTASSVATDKQGESTEKKVTSNRQCDPLTECDTVTPGTHDSDSVTHDGDSVTPLTRDRATPGTHDGDIVTHDGDSVTRDGDSVTSGTRDHHIVTSVTHDSDSVTHDGDSVTHDGDSVTSVTRDGDSVTPGTRDGDIVTPGTHGGDSVTSVTHDGSHVQSVETIV